MTLHAINAKNIAPSEYTGLSLLAIAVHDGRLYGITATALLEFTGTDDTGTDIDAYIKTGKVDFGSGALKRYPRLYLGGTASGGLTATVTTEESGEETEREYSVPSWNGNLREKRVKLSRKPKSRYVQVKIENVDGGTMVVEQAKVMVDMLPRRH